MTPARCLRLAAALAPPLLLLPPWAASFVRYFDARLAGPHTALYGALNGGRLDLEILKNSRGFPPPAFAYGVYPPFRHDPFWECDLRFAGFGFGRSGIAKFKRAVLTCPPWLMPLVLLAPAAAVVLRRLRPPPAEARDADRRRMLARRVMLASPALAVMLTIGVCAAADQPPDRRPSLDRVPAVALAAFPILAAAGSAAGGLLTAPPAPRGRRKAAAAGATLGVLAYWLALTGLSLLIVVALIGLSLLIL